MSKQKKAPAKKAAKKAPAKKAPPKKAAKRAPKKPTLAAANQDWAGPGPVVEVLMSKPKQSLMFRFRSAISGLFVRKDVAQAAPGTTVRERVKRSA